MRLMIVDDHAGIRALIRQLFGPAATEVCECSSADEALRHVPEFKPDYVTMDVRMPGLCAFDAVRTIRQTHPPAAVVMVSSYNEPELRRKAVDVGAIGYVLKENLADLHNLLQRHSAPQAAALHSISRKAAADLPHDLMSPMARLAARVEELELYPAFIANELKMPLQTMQNFGAILQRQPLAQLSAEAQTCLHRIVEACAAMSQRVDALLAYGQSDTRVSRMDLVATEQLVQDCWRLLARTEPAARVSFRTGRLPHVRGDSRLLHVVFTNLLHNALKFSAMRERPQIEINCCRVRTHVVFSLSDNGVGFDKTHASRLFVPLVRLHPVEQFPGAGLGLALARRIVHLHGGRIWVEAEPDRGATFYFTLPCDPPEEPAKPGTN